MKISDLGESSAAIGEIVGGYLADRQDQLALTTEEC